MSNLIVKDIGEIYSRLFNCRPFLNGEIKYFIKEFEENRQDREIEGLFTALQNTIELRDSSLDRCRTLSEKHLPNLKQTLLEAKDACEAATEDSPIRDTLIQNQEKNRVQREQLWEQFTSDMNHKRSRIDNTFEEKEEELREFYSDLERKLHIHN